MDNLTDRIKRLEQENIYLTSALQKTLKRIELLETQFHNTTDRELEITYQKYLEIKFGASHGRNAHGISDIETDDSIIEIKHWKNYKSAIGQLECYSDATRHKRKILYLFGQKPKDIKFVIRICQDKHISMFHLLQLDNGEIIEETLVDTFADTPFKKWLDEHLRPLDNGIVTLKQICEIFNKKESSNAARLEIESYIMFRYPGVKHLYGKVRVSSSSTCYGWKNFMLV
jgi:hypothetical protein